MKSLQDVQEELRSLLGPSYEQLPSTAPEKIKALNASSEQHLRDARVVKLLTQETLALLDRFPDTNELARCHALLSHAYMETGDNRQAIQHAQHSLSHLDETQAKKRLLPIRMLAIAHRRLHDFEPALTYALEALDIAEAQQPEKRTSAMSALANLYLELEYYPQAITMISHALELAQQDDHAFAICALHNNLAFAHLLAENLDQALSYAEQAKTMAHELDELTILASVYETLGRIYLKEKRYATSLGHLLDAARYAERGDLQITYQSVLRHIAHVRLALGHSDEAAEALEEALAIAITLDDRAEQSNAYQELADIYFRQGKSQEAFSYLHKHTQLLKELSQAKSEQHLSDLRTSYETKHAQELARLEHEKNIELTRVNQELAQVNAQLEAKHEEQRNMVTMLTHDLKNPLTLLMGYPELAEQKPDKAYDFLQQSYIHAQRMYQLIVNFLELNRLESGLLSFNIQRHDLVAHLAKAVHAIGPEARNKGIDIELLVPTQLFAYSDEHAILRVMDNYLSNALKFSPPNRSIRIKLYHQDKQAVCQVEDKGDGLSAEDKTELFKKFTRLSAQPTAGEHSSGLGLAICKLLVERMHGKVWAESEGKGRGSSFFFSLPLD